MSWLWILISVFKELLSDHSLDLAMVNLMLQLPSEAQLHEQAATIYVKAIHRRVSLPDSQSQSHQQHG